MLTKDHIFSNSLIVFYHGSDTYGVLKTKESDHDIIALVDDFYFNIIEDELDENNQIICVEGKEVYDIEVMKESTMINMLQTSHIVALEFAFLPEEFIIHGVKLYRNYLKNKYLSLDNVRHTISQIVSNSYVKCRKKLEVEKDYNPYVAVKSMFHAMRIAMFGVQLGRYGKIVDFGCANFIWNDLVLGKVYDWEEIKKRYQPFRNALLTEFRRLYNFSLSMTKLKLLLKVNHYQMKLYNI